MPAYKNRSVLRIKNLSLFSNLEVGLTRGDVRDPELLLKQAQSQIQKLRNRLAEKNRQLALQKKQLRALAKTETAGEGTPTPEHEGASPVAKEFEGTLPKERRVQIADANNPFEGLRPEQNYALLIDPNNAETLLRAGGRRSTPNLVPPVELIAENNIGIHDKENVLDEYKRIGDSVAEMLKNRAGLRPESDVLDVGCGTGRVARPLTEYLTTGSYTGVDIVKSSVEWCRENFRNFPNFRFIHADLFSEFYNPNAVLTAEEYRFPFDQESFDVIWSSSLFTHMLMPAVANYLKEMARVAKPGGRIWNSYLLLDEISEPLVLGPRNDGRRMQFEVEGGRVGYKNKPEHVVGLYKDQIMALHEKHGFEIIEVQLSNWSGGRPDIKHRGQDVIIARKKDGQVEMAEAGT